MVKPVNTMPTNLNVKHTLDIIINYVKTYSIYFETVFVIVV